MRPFDDLCVLEPKLKQLEERILAHVRQQKDADWYCAPLWWYGYGPEGMGYKDRMRPLVGVFAAVPELRNEHAYNIATWHLQGLLPACKNCECRKNVVMP